MLSSPETIRREPVTATPSQTLPVSAAPTSDQTASQLAELIRTTLDDGKAEDIVTIDLEGKSSIADFLIIASGRSDRQVIALADQVASKMKDAGLGRCSTEGADHGDWVLVDAGDVIVHIFRPEVRTYYNLEKMWGALGADRPA
jgi:ribosome-associated protein